MQALVTSPPSDAVVRTVPIPVPGRRQLLVRVKAIALNPVDALYVAKPNGLGKVVGSDFAGIVEAVGEGVNEKRRGERVAGFVHGACHENVDYPGAFADYVVVDEDLVYVVPSNVDLEEASTLPLCLNTAANGLYTVLELLPPWTESSVATISAPRPAIVIYSGATSVGCFAIQLAALSPSNPLIITTSSPSNFALLRSLGAHHVLDYHSANWIEEVKNIAKRERAVIRWAYDCISEGTTVGTLSGVFDAGTKGKIVCIRGPTQWDKDKIQEGVDADYMSVWTSLGKEFWYNGGNYFPAEPTHRALAVQVYKYISSSNSDSPLASGKLKGNNIRLMPGGLENIANDAFPLLGTGRVTERGNEGVGSAKPLSGEKMVYRLEQD